MKFLSLDLEHDGLNPLTAVIWSLTVAYDKQKPIIYHNCNGLTKKDLPKQLVKDLENPSICKLAHNAANDGSMLLAQFGIRVRNWGDTMLREIVIQGVALPYSKKKTLTEYETRLRKAHGVSLDYTLQRYGLGTLDKDIRENFINRPVGLAFTKKELAYMVDDVRPLLPLYMAQEFLLTRDRLMEVALLECRYVEKRIAAKVYGIGFDAAIWREVANANTVEWKKRMAKLPSIVENWNSPKQVKDYFKYNHDITITEYKSKSPDVDDLDSLYIKTKNKTLGDFIFAREMHKAVTSYGLNWFEEDYIQKDGRIHPDVTQIKETGRVSMSNPNLQQLPGYGRKDSLHELVMSILYKKDKKIKWRHRAAFVPKKGHVFVIGDFSGQEIGIMASAAEEKLWVDTMLRGDDVHSLTASLLYATEWNEGREKSCTFPKKCSCPNHITPRERAKILNFMLAYGGGATRFSKNTGLDMLESRITVARYRKVIPRLSKYLAKCAANALDTGVSFSADPYRRRRVLRAEQNWRIENQGKNNPIQAAGANMLKLAAISIPDEFYSPLEIHDEIILEVPKAKAKEALKMLKTVMEKSADYITGIKGLIKADPRIAMNLLKEAGTKGHDLYGNKITKA
jgi:DNA polymerase I-like protein with 3'-5' exonuclease and polymerase domains